ncbi:hypothetical protein ANN_02514 [Periplaneta americana]|uniref:PH domain-containing protein n=1 Tax=Periplaneta americana TaxID=6978 RepID=A0ABQ8TWH3_PERAM|nr:hypothetical protein ANN_02514 [Periplaneta americana]
MLSFCLLQRWRKRWFVLRHSGELPGQYFLEYYTDRNCRKLKGKIDLDQCEQVDAGLRFENRKQKYQHMFDVKTPKRVYYLAAESEEDMNKWVEYVCHVCGLKAYKDEEDEYDYGPPAEDEEPATTSESLTNEQQDPMLGPVTESPPVSPTSTISGPYIPISECISGKSLSSPNGLEDFNNILRQGGYGLITAAAQYGLTNKEVTNTWQKNAQCIENQTQGSSRLCATGETVALLQGKTPTLPLKRPPRPCDATAPAESAEFYDSPRKLHPPNLEHRQISSTTPPPQSPTTDGESVFTDEEWSAPAHRPPSVNWDTFPNTDGESVRQNRPSDSSAEVDLGSGGDIGSWSVVKRFGKLTVVDNVGSVPRDGPIAVHGRQLSLPTNLQHQPVAPPRPPKPFHLLLEAPSHNYLNLENVSPRPRNRNARKSSVASQSSDTSKRTGVPPSPNDCVSASDGNEEPPSPLSVPQSNELVGVSDEMYDFPRSHQNVNNPSSPSAVDGVENKISAATLHFYTNAAPIKVNGEVFRYDFHDSSLGIPQEGASVVEEPISPRSDGSSSLASSSTAAIYSNLPSPLTAQGTQSGTDLGQNNIPTPPAVNRGLKPRRKLSDSTSAVSNEPSPVSPATHLLSGPFPPSVDRKLKPQMKQSEQEPLPLAAPPACRSGSENSRSLKRTRAAPSPTPPSATPTILRNGQRQRSEHNSSSDDDHRNSPEVNEPIYYYQQDSIFVPATRFEDLQYLDLDLECDAASGTTATTQIPKSPERTQPTSTVYKTVDFVKTEAFNRTRQEVEEVRKQCTAAEL